MVGEYPPCAAPRAIDSSLCVRACVRACVCVCVCVSVSGGRPRETTRPAGPDRPTTKGGRRLGSESLGDWVDRPGPHRAPSYAHTHTPAARRTPWPPGLVLRGAPPQRSAAGSASWFSTSLADILTIFARAADAHRVRTRRAAAGSISLPHEICRRASIPARARARGYPRQHVLNQSRNQMNHSPVVLDGLDACSIHVYQLQSVAAVDPGREMVLPPGLYHYCWSHSSVSRFRSHPSCRVIACLREKRACRRVFA